MAEKNILKLFIEVHFMFLCYLASCFFFITSLEFNEISSLLTYPRTEMDRKIDEIKLMPYIYPSSLSILYIQMDDISH